MDLVLELGKGNGMSEAPLTAESPVPVVSPEKTKTQKKSEDRKPASQRQEEDSDEDRKPAATRQEEDSDDEESSSDHEDDNEPINADTVMGFERFPDSSNREIMLLHHDFVRWARSRENITSGSRLESFIAWADSNEGRKLEVQGEGNEKFTFGQHCGETFSEISESDPGYHHRYMKMLRKKGEKPKGMLERYIKWFNEFGPKTKSKRASQIAAPRKRQKTARYLDGNERFPFGQHRGEKFSQVAYEDPGYHLRYKDMDDRPNPVLDSYNRYGPGPYAAMQAQHEDFGAILGIWCPGCDEYTRGRIDRMLSHGRMRD